MLNFDLVRKKEKTYDELISGLSQEDLRDLTNEMINTQLNIISDCEDSDVVFFPQDPNAYDSFASTEEEVNIAWTLGHVIVHITASSEESAFLSAELARGVPHRGGRSRFEVSWETITSIKQCRDRLDESRHMRLASLDLWPNKPHLDNTYESRFGLMVNPILQFVFGLSHDDSHLDQMKEILRQSKKALI
jgi:hypothetical protein